MTHPYVKDFEAVRKHFARQLARFGDTPQGVQWRDRSSQEQRMVILAGIAPLRNARILDFGCGTGHFLHFLRQYCQYTGEFIGYDITPQMIAQARAKFPEARFECRDVLRDGIPTRVQYAFVNGVFNYAMRDSWGFMTAALKVLFAACSDGISFNCLSKRAAAPADYLAYYAPDEVFRFCQDHLSEHVVLRHDYRVRAGEAPGEMTFYVYRAT